MLVVPKFLPGGDNYTSFLEKTRLQLRPLRILTNHMSRIKTHSKITDNTHVHTHTYTCTHTRKGPLKYESQNEISIEHIRPEYKIMYLLELIRVNY